MLGPPTRNPRLDVVQWNGVAGYCEFVEAPAVLGNIGAGQIDDRIEQRHCFGKNRGDILPALGRHFAEPRVGAGVDLKGAANNVHEVQR